MLCARALVRALNDAKNRAQRGCAMQFSGITLSQSLLEPFAKFNLSAFCRDSHFVKPGVIKHVLLV